MAFLVFHGIQCDKHNSRGKNLIIVALKRAFENYFILCYAMNFDAWLLDVRGRSDVKRKDENKIRGSSSKREIKEKLKRHGCLNSTICVWDLSKIKRLCASFSNPKTQDVKIAHLTVSWASVIYIWIRRSCQKENVFLLWDEISLCHEMSFLDEYKTD